MCHNPTHTPQRTLGLFDRAEGIEAPTSLICRDENGHLAAEAAVPLKGVGLQCSRIDSIERAIRAKESFCE
jgi:hypothetical protein